VGRALRPEGPIDPTEWLSTSDIEEVLDQYENPFADFEFLGAVPADCAELDFCSLFRLNFGSKLKSGKTKLGVVFNHDIHGDPGSHWVALYIDIAKCQIYYSDSTGKKPINRIKKVIDTFCAYCKSGGTECTYKYNTNKYQRDDSECGVYSCNFIIRLLNGESFDEVVGKPLGFDEINLCRNRFFSNEPVTNKKKRIPKMCDPGVGAAS